MAETDSLCYSAANTARRKQAAEALDALCRDGMQRDFYGRLTLEIDVKAGSIVGIEKHTRQRIKPPA